MNDVIDKLNIEDINSLFEECYKALGEGSRTNKLKNLKSSIDNNVRFFIEDDKYFYSGLGSTLAEAAEIVYDKYYQKWFKRRTIQSILKPIQFDENQENYDLFMKLMDKSMGYIQSSIKLDPYF